MALFKILKGKKDNLQDVSYNEGWAYVTTDEPAMYVDISDSERIKLYDYLDNAVVKGAGAANRLAMYDSTGLLTYLGDSELTVGDGTSLTLQGSFVSGKSNKSGAKSFEALNDNGRISLSVTSEGMRGLFDVETDNWLIKENANSAETLIPAWGGTGSSNVPVYFNDEGKPEECNCDLNHITYFVNGTQTAATGAWAGDLPQVEEPYDGLTIRYYLPYAGSGNATLSLNGGTAYPIYRYGVTSQITTHFAAGSVIDMTFRTSYNVSGTTKTNAWIVSAAYYSDTHIRVYRQTSGYNSDYPLLVSRTGLSSIGTSGTNGSYAAVCGVIGNNGTYSPTVNPHTGVMKIKATTASSSTTTGALIVSGGIGAAGNIYASTFNGYTLNAASAKAVTDSTSASAISTGTSLVTERDVYYGLPNINSSHSYNSSTNIFAPTSAGTKNQILTSAGSGAPTWIDLSDLRANLGLSSALRFIGVTTTLVTDGNSSATVSIDGSNVTATTGDVVIVSATDFEYVWTGSAWEKLGGDGSYKIVQTAVEIEGSSGIEYVHSISQTANGEISALTSEVRSATTSQSGLMSKEDKTKLDGITASADSVSFTGDLTSGTQVGTITINGIGTVLYAPTNTDTHYTTGLKVGASATATANAAATNGNVYLNVLDNSTVRDSHNIVGSGATTVTSDANGKITISSTNTHYTAYNYIGAADSASNAATSNGSTYIKLYENGSKRSQFKISGTGATSVSSDASGNISISSTNTDTKVTQTVTTSNAAYPILLAPNGQTATTTTTTYFDSGVTLNPSTNTIAANISGSATTITNTLDIAHGGTGQTTDKTAASWTAGTTGGPVLNITFANNTSKAITTPSASASNSGIVTTGTQTFAGTKTFSSTIQGSISGNAASSTYATYGRIIETDASSDTSYYPIWTAGYTSSTNYVLRANSGFKFTTLTGTTSTNGYGCINLGNATAAGTDGNKYGALRLFGTDTYYWNISGAKAAGANRFLYLPQSGGCLVAATNGSAVGDLLSPVHISSAGVATTCTVTGSGNRWGCLTYIAADGVMEAGMYIDFHTSDADTSDYAVRLIAGSNSLTCSGTFSATAVYNAVWNDYAECFPRGEETEAGDIVALDLNSEEEHYVKAIAGENVAIGVHSDSYGHLIGMDEGDIENEEEMLRKFIPVGLAGRVWVKVTAPVRKGAFIGASEIPGVGCECDRSEAIGICVDNNMINGKVKIKIL